MRKHPHHGVCSDLHADCACSGEPCCEDELKRQLRKAWRALNGHAPPPGNIYVGVGVALAAHPPANRSAVFLTSKLHPRDHGEQRLLEAFPESLRRLNTSYLDAFLLHYPHCFGGLCEGQPQGNGVRATRSRAGDRHRVEKVGSNPQSCPI